MNEKTGLREAEKFESNILDRSTYRLEVINFKGSMPADGQRKETS